MFDRRKHVRLRTRQTMRIENAAETTIAVLIRIEKSNFARADNRVSLIDLFPTALHHNRGVCSCDCTVFLDVKGMGQPVQTDRTRRPLSFDFIYLSHYSNFWKVIVQDAPRNCDSTHIFFMGMIQLLMQPKRSVPIHPFNFV